MTPLAPVPPTATGRPLRDGSSSLSTSTKKASMSTWRIGSVHTSRSYREAKVIPAKLMAMAALVHLVRHGEVDNPDHLVYADLPGFGLSPHGVEQARRVGRYLGPRPVVAIWSSPLERSLRTAEEIAARTGVPVRVEEDLTEWQITQRWKGHSWRSIPERFPGELEAYLEQPAHLPFDVEPLAELAERIAQVARRLDLDHPHGDVVMVSHQDPIQAGRLKLVGAPLSSFHDEKPGHGAVITLRPGNAWREETAWEPGESPRFGEKSGLRVVATTPSAPPPSTA